jgi:hypothetical protein
MKAMRKQYVGEFKTKVGLERLRGERLTCRRRDDCRNKAPFTSLAHACSILAA